MKILVPTSGGEAAEEVADYVIATARQLDAEILVLHILQTGESKENGKQCCDVFVAAAHDTGVTVETCLLSGDVVDSILATVKKSKPDMILMGASKGKIVEHWLSAEVMEECEMPVLVIPHCYQQ